MNKLALSGGGHQWALWEGDKILEIAYDSKLIRLNKSIRNVNSINKVTAALRNVYELSYNVTNSG